MRTETVIRIQASSGKGGHSKAMQVAAAIDGVESVTLAGEGKNLLRVVGDGVDSNHLTTRLRRKVGHADIVELRTLQGHRGYTGTITGGAAGGGYHSSLDGGCGDVVAAYGMYGNYPAASYAPVAAADQYYQQPSSYEYYPPAAPPYGTTVVRHEYRPTGDPNGCCIM